MFCDPTSDESSPLTADIRHASPGKLDSTLKFEFPFAERPRLWPSWDSGTKVVPFNRTPGANLIVMPNVCGLFGRYEDLLNPEYPKKGHGKNPKAGNGA